MKKSTKTAEVAAKTQKSQSKTSVIHYHHDTKQIHETLLVGNIYQTSKGVGKYTGRSWSNGKLLFKGLDGITNMYFTAKEWRDGNNSSKNVDKVLIKKISKEVDDKNSVVLKGMVKGKTLLMDRFSGDYGKYLGVNHMGMIEVKMDDAGKTEYAMDSDTFKKRMTTVSSKPKKQEPAPSQYDEMLNEVKYLMKKLNM